MRQRLIFLLLTLCLLTACGAPAASPTEGAIPVRFVLDWIPNINHAGIYIADSQNYFADEGLSVEILQPPEGGALPLLTAGHAEFCVSFQEELAAAITAETPLPVVAVAAILQHNTSGILSPKNKNIRSPRDLEGRRYATWDMPVELAILETVMTRDGGDFSRLVRVPSTVTDVMTALATDIDAVWVYYGVDGVAAEQLGVETNFFLFSDFDPALDFYTPVIASSEAFLREHPDTARKFLKAAARGYAYAAAHPDEAADILVAAAPETDRDLAVAGLRYLAGQFVAEAPRWGEIDQTRWDGFMDWLNNEELLPRAIAPGEGFSNDYLS